VLVDVKGRTATLPAANFSGQGNALVSTMTQGQISKAANSSAMASGAAASSGR